MNYDYWNNIEIEKTKAYWIEDKSDLKLIHFIQKETNLQRCFQDAVEFSKQLRGGHLGQILDVGAGVAWTSALLSKLEQVDSVTAMDYSRHRLFQIAPIVFEQLDGDISKFKPIIGDFSDFDFKTGQFDIVLFCQSLYMFPFLDEVLAKVSKLLVPEGMIMVVCERITPEFPFFSINSLKRRLKQFLGGRADSSGNYYYEDKEYRHAIVTAGFKYQFQLLDYPVYPKSNLNAGNHFGIKTDQS
jgi:SAM-dependent methyltransferase